MSNLTFSGINQVEKIEQAQRIRERRERQEKKKEDDHWIFVAGTLVAKYLKADLGITVYKGKDATAKNKVSFTPLENILSYLADHKDFIAQIASGVRDPPDFP